MLLPQFRLHGVYLAVLIGALAPQLSSAQTATASGASATTATAPSVAMGSPGNLGGTGVGTLAGGAADLSGNSSAKAALSDNTGGAKVGEGQTADLAKSAAVKDLGAGETEFQRFVFASTGKPLPLFGYNLFNNPAQYAPVLAAPVPDSYILGPGDELVVQTFGLVDVSERLIIDRDGRVNIPKVGPLVLAGLPVAQAEKALTAHVGKVFQNFTLSLSMGRIRSLEVFVVGQARKPGKHVVSGLSTLVNALFETGGPNANGSLRQLQLRRGGKTIANVDLYQFLAKGDLSADVRLQSGDVIVIPPAGARAALLGTLNAPAIYELKAGDSIQSVLELSGGLPALAAPQKAQLERLNAQRNIPRYVEDFALDAQGLQRPLQAGDVLTVFQISPQIDSVVTLQGHVAAPMRYNFKPGMKVSDLLSDPRLLITGDYWQQLNAGNNPGKLPVVNFDYATIKRLNPATLRTELLTFNLGQAIAQQPAANLLLQSGDIVTVYSSADVALPVEKRLQQVTLEGEVNIPGTYQLLPGETLPQLIRRAGGLTPNAFLYAATFTRESTRLKQQENLDKALRRAEADLSNQSSSLLQNQNVKDQTAVQAQIELQKQQMARLRDLKASGRIALEVVPQAQQLPGIKLENGDRINIPTSPDFVGVQGEVLAENAFMHRPGDTVASYLERAGVTRDADLDSLMLVRANGSVESASMQSGLLGWASDFKNRQVFPGDMVFVPAKVDRRTGYTRFIEGAKDWTSIFYQFGLGAAAIKTLNNAN